MINYTTTVESVKYHKIEGNLEKVIKWILVKKVGETPEGYKSEFWDKLEFETPHESQFTPYDEITQPMMLSWIDSHPSGFNQKSEGHISALIQQQIESNEVETTQLPYA